MRASASASERRLGLHGHRGIQSRMPRPIQLVLPANQTNLESLQSLESLRVMHFSWLARIRAVKLTCNGRELAEGEIDRGLGSGSLPHCRTRTRMRNE